MTDDTEDREGNPLIHFSGRVANPQNASRRQLPPFSIPQSLSLLLWVYSHLTCIF